MRLIYAIAADVLRALGWEVEINEKDSYWNLVLTNTSSSEDMPESHKSCLRGLLRGWLMEFNYECGRQQVNIYKELQADLGITPPRHGCLESLARNGVLLLNTVLTVRAHAAHSHKGKGWEIFTNHVIEKLNQRQEPMVFILWGKPAKEKAALITNPRHAVLTGAHPSPLSAHYGFWGGRYFSRTNEFLTANGQEPIDWRIPE